MPVSARLRRFASNVWVNIVANLAVLVIGYPVGVVVGLFPPNPIAARIATVAALLAAFAVLNMVAVSRTDRWDPTLTGIAAVCLVPLAFISDALTHGIVEEPEGRVSILIAIVAFIVLIGTPVNVVLQRRRNARWARELQAAARGPIRGPRRVINPHRERGRRRIDRTTRERMQRARRRSASPMTPLRGRRGLSRRRRRTR